jgi:hypothetical protein
MCRRFPSQRCVSETGDMALEKGDILIVLRLAHSDG